MADLFLEELGDLLHRVNRKLRVRANEELAPLGITPAQSRALRTLVGHGEPLRMSELAERLGIARRSATAVVDELVDRRLVRRRDDPADRRATTVEVTARGAALAGRMARRRREALRELTADLSTDEVAELRRLLRRLVG